MKKIISFLVICLVILCSCGKKNEEGFYLNYNGKRMELNQEYSVDTYGEYNSSFENTSCAFGDRDITYFYRDIEVETYGDSRNKLIVYSIRIIGDEQKTNEGIGLYDEISDAIAKYGDNYVKDDNKYEYIKGGTSLIFITQDDIIESIEYRVTNIG